MLLKLNTKPNSVIHDAAMETVFVAMEIEKLDFEIAKTKTWLTSWVGHVKPAQLVCARRPRLFCLKIRKTK